MKAKARQKAHKDATTNTKPHNIKKGDYDQVLLLQEQTNSNIQQQEEPPIRTRDSQRSYSHHQPNLRAIYGDTRYPLDLHTEETSIFD